MADTQVAPLGVVAAPADWTLPPAQVLTIAALFAHFDGSGAGSAYVPTVQIISDAGKTILEVPMDSLVAAGSSVEASWAPFLRTAGVVATTPGGLIKSVLLAADAASVVFTGIPQSFRDLQIIAAARSDNAAGNDSCAFQINGDNSLINDWIVFNASTIGGLQTVTFGSVDRIAIGEIPAALTVAGEYGSLLATIPAYTDATHHVHIVSTSHNEKFTGVTELVISLYGGTYRANGPVTSLIVLPYAGANFKAGSQFDLYGL